MTSFRVLYTLSMYRHLLIESVILDVAFLNAESKEDVQIEAPVGLKSVEVGMVLKLDNLKQPSSEWNMALDKVLREDLKMIG